MNWLNSTMCNWLTGAEKAVYRMTTRGHTWSGNVYKYIFDNETILKNFKE